MRLLWYAGASAALATGVVGYAFNQRANFYSAMVYLSQNNLSLMILVNLVLLVYASFVWGLQRLCYGPLRPVEIEQLYEKAWFAVTETCLAMTIFREEVGAWFLVMFTALVTGKVWEWIGEGRVEVLEQQPPTNPRLFHTRLSVSLFLSMAYDIWMLTYTVRTVIQQARPNMMVMFLFEFAILTACSFRTVIRYILSLVEARIVKQQTQSRLAERRRLVMEQRNDILRRRESDDAAEAEAARQEELPDEDVDEMDIEVPGWESKGQWNLSLDLMTDLLKLAIYMAFFAILTMFYGLPIHIMRDLFLTARSFLKRLSALLRYRKAVQDMNRYPDAVQEDLQRQDTCIICREEMRPWDPSSPGVVERSRPKKLPCGHILHLGCLKGWLERQQICPICRRSVVNNNAGTGAAVDGAGAGAEVGGVAAQGGNGGAQPLGPAPIVPGGGGGDVGGPQPGQGRGNLRVYRFGPLQLGIAQGGDAIDLVDRMRNQHIPHAALPTPPVAAPTVGPVEGLSNIDSLQAQIQDISNRVQQEMNALQTTQAELQILYSLTLELNRLRQTQPQAPGGVASHPIVQGGLNVHLAHQHARQHAQYIAQHHVPHHVQHHVQHQAHQLAQHLAQHPAHLSAASHTHQPTVTSYGGAQYTSAIPSGSPDLPEGVTIPPGWSMLRLQRLDDPPTAMDTSVSNDDTSSRTASGHVESSSGDNTISRTAGGQVESSSASTQRDDHSLVAGSSSVQSEGDESHADDSGNDSERLDTGSTNGKGKARAVSLEEVEDDGSD